MAHMPLSLVLPLISPVTLLIASWTIQITLLMIVYDRLTVIITVIKFCIIYMYSYQFILNSLKLISTTHEVATYLCQWRLK